MKNFALNIDWIDINWVKDDVCHTTQHSYNKDEIKLEIYKKYAIKSIKLFQPACMKTGSMSLEHTK